MATKTKAAPKQAAKPLTIEIHGETIDLVATIKQSPEFADGLHEGFSKIAELFTQLNGSRAPIRERDMCVPSNVSDGSCLCGEETVEQLKSEHTHYLNVAEHIERELEKRGVGFVNDRDLAAAARLLGNMQTIETSWLEDAQKRIQAELAARPRA